jgi:hypothetical protein
MNSWSDWAYLVLFCVLSGLVVPVVQGIGEVAVDALSSSSSSVFLRGDYDDGSEQLLGLQRRDGLGLARLAATFVLHWVGQLLYHRNINRLVVRKFRRKYGLLQGGTGGKDSDGGGEKGRVQGQGERFRWKEEDVVWVKLRGVLGGALRTLSCTFPFLH